MKSPSSLSNNEIPFLLKNSNIHSLKVYFTDMDGLKCILPLEDTGVEATGVVAALVSVLTLALLCCWGEGNE